MEDSEIELLLRRHYGGDVEVLRHHRTNPTLEQEERIAAKLQKLQKAYGDDFGLIKQKLNEWCDKQGIP